MAFEHVIFSVVAEAVVHGERQTTEAASFTLAGVRMIAEIVTGPDGAQVLRGRAGLPPRQGVAQFEKTFMAPAIFRLYRNSTLLQEVEVRSMFNPTVLDLSNQG